MRIVDVRYRRSSIAQTLNPHTDHFWPAVPPSETFRRQEASETHHESGWSAVEKGAGRSGQRTCNRDLAREHHAGARQYA